MPARDPAALAAAIDDVLTDRALAGRLVTSGRERVRRFEWPALARDVLDVYAEALAA